MTQSTCTSTSFKQTLAPLKLFGKDNSEDMTGFACIASTQSDSSLIGFWTLISDQYVANCNTKSSLLTLNDGITVACVNKKIVDNGYGCKNFKSVAASANANLFECA